VSRITTHVLDIAHGEPARNVAVKLEHHSLSQGWVVLAEKRTDGDGRVKDLLAEETVPRAGRYRITFVTGEYFEGRGTRCFHPIVEVVFEIQDAAQHYHVPLLVSPFGYSTYRGS
jgi:5-hydroxyisourate hydrolase